jgi:hypothetical protein|uniref:DHHW family protein n=1 Tax=Fluviicola sp. TaxID=1917219 RepID=UPI00404A17F0
MIHKINVIVFVGAILIGTTAFFTLKKEKISQAEKRELAEMKPFNWQTFSQKEWSKGTAAYLADHFPFRTALIDGSDKIKAARGIIIESQERIILAKKPTKKQKEVVDPSISHLEYVDDFEEDYTGDLLILNGKVYNLTGGSTKMAAVFAKMVNEYASALKGHTTVYTAVPPVACAFIPVEKYKKYNTQNRNTLAAIGTNLKNGAVFSDVFTELNNHTGEQLFFGTDHHWNATGAYYGYVAFCKAAGLTPVPLEKMDKKIKYGFLGTMYQTTRDQSVKENADTFKYYIPKVATKALRYSEYNYNSPQGVSVFANSNGGNMYSTFVSGDHPLIKITTGVKNGRKCAVVKNSMGNAFSVFLISHYEEIYVVDFRYSKHNLMSLILENKIDDLIFAVGLYATMSNGTINMMRRLASHAGMAPPAPVVNPSNDTLQKTMNQQPDTL